MFKKDLHLCPQQGKRGRVAPRRYIEECDYFVYTLNIASEVKGLDEPSTYKEATK